MANNDDILGLFSKASSAGADKGGFFSGHNKKSDSGAIYTLQYGTEQLSRPWRAGLTVAQAFKEVASELSFDSGRAVAYKARGQIVQPTVDIEPGVTYSANATHEMKGL